MRRAIILCSQQEKRKNKFCSLRHQTTKNSSKSWETASFYLKRTIETHSTPRESRMQGKKGHKTFIPGPASIGNPCHLYGPQIESSFSRTVRFGCCRPPLWSEIFRISFTRAREEGIEREDEGKAKSGSERLMDIGVGRGLRLGGRHFSLSLSSPFVYLFSTLP